MKSLSGKELGKVLEEHGWQLLRIHGSHHIYGKSGLIARLSVPMHGNRAVKRGLLLHLLKAAGIDPAEL
ncbi:MAG: type II toxin-antitoxin system HicA family toxin [Candidatus Korobacteraceae bacterium]